MSEPVNILFHLYLRAGESSFNVELPRKFLDDPNSRFGFEAVTLMPEYQNIQAFAYKLDSKTELELPIVNPLQLQVTYGPNYHSKEEGKTWSYSSSQTRLDAVLLSINQHFDLNRPAGTCFPSVFFDWFHLDSLETEETVREYSIKTAEDAYGETFDPTKHATWLPASLASMTSMNNCVFPSTNNAEYLADTRIRMWIAPNTTITFSNANLPLVLGFEEASIPPKTQRGQIAFVNEDVTEFKQIILFGAPTVTNLPIANLKNSNMNSYTTKNTIVSPQEQLVTQKQHEKNPVKLLDDYAPVIKNLGKCMNLLMDLEYDEAVTKKFKVVFPSNPNIAVSLLLPIHVMRQMGFDPSRGEYIDQKSTASSISGTLDTTELAKKALALVYDTGMVAVDLADERDCMNTYSGNFNMTYLFCQPDATMRNQNNLHCDVPRVHVSSRNKELKFFLYRFDDLNRKYMLDWPVGAYIYGLLSSKTMDVTKTKAEKHQKKPSQKSKPASKNV